MSRKRQSVCKRCKKEGVALFWGRCYECKWKYRLLARVQAGKIKLIMKKRAKRIKPAYQVNGDKPSLIEHKGWPESMMYDRKAVKKLCKDE